MREASADTSDATKRCEKEPQQNAQPTDATRIAAHAPHQHCSHAMTTRARKRRTPNNQGRAHMREQDAQPSAASVHRHSRRLQVRDIRTPPLIGNAASRPIGNALAKEKLTNDIQNTVNHSTTPISTTPRQRAARRHEKRAHPEVRGARDADETYNSAPAASRTTSRTPTTR